MKSTRFSEGSVEGRTVLFNFLFHGPCPPSIDKCHYQHYESVYIMVYALARIEIYRVVWSINISPNSKLHQWYALKQRLDSDSLIQACQIGHRRIRQAVAEKGKDSDSG